MENMKDFQENIEWFKEDFGSEKMGHFSKELVLENVSLAYTDRAVIQNVSLEIKRNESIA